MYCSNVFYVFELPWSFLELKESPRLVLSRKLVGLPRMHVGNMRNGVQMYLPIYTQ